MFRKVAIFIALLVVVGVASVSLLEFADASPAPEGGFPVEIDLPQLDCAMIVKMTTYGDQKLGELYLQIEDVMGRWANEYPVTDEEKREYEEVYAKSVPLRYEQRLIIFGSELLDGYRAKYCNP